MVKQFIEVTENGATDDKSSVAGNNFQWMWAKVINSYHDKKIF